MIGKYFMIDSYLVLVCAISGNTVESNFWYDWDNYQQHSYNTWDLREFKDKAREVPEDIKKILIKRELKK